MIEDTFEAIKSRMLQYLENAEATDVSIEEYEEGCKAVNESIAMLSDLIKNFDKIELPANDLSAKFPEMVEAMDTIDKCRTLCVNVSILSGLLVTVIKLLFIIKEGAIANSN
jgi:hypothetical protein